MVAFISKKNKIWMDKIAAVSVLYVILIKKKDFLALKIVPVNAVEKG